MVRRWSYLNFILKQNNLQKKQNLRFILQDTLILRSNLKHYYINNFLIFFFLYFSKNKSFIKMSLLFYKTIRTKKLYYAKMFFFYLNCLYIPSTAAQDDYIKQNSIVIKPQMADLIRNSNKLVLFFPTTAISDATFFLYYRYRLVIALTSTSHKFVWLRSKLVKLLYLLYVTIYYKFLKNYYKLIVLNTLFINYLNLYVF